MAWIALRARVVRRAGEAVPVGYGLGLVGVGVFLASAVGDGIWHTLFGVEVGSRRSSARPTSACSWARC
jgi:hypothetical protein